MDKTTSKIQTTSTTTKVPMTTVAEETITMLKLVADSDEVKIDNLKKQLQAQQQIHAQQQLQNQQRNVQRVHNPSISESGDFSTSKPHERRADQTAKAVI